MSDFETTSNEEDLTGQDLTDSELPNQNTEDGDQGANEKDQPRPSKSIAHLEEEGDVGADYLEGLLDIVDLDGDIEIDVVNGRATLSIEGGDLKNLVGEKGEVLDALQELTRLAVQTSLGERSRLMLDIDNYRANQKAELIELAKESAEQVKESGESLKLKPMNAFERKVIHDTIQELGLSSESEGEEPNRAVVILPEA
jgi:spoIIIJ-associated protein